MQKFKELTIINITCLNKRIFLILLTLNYNKYNRAKITLYLPFFA